MTETPLPVTGHVRGAARTLVGIWLGASLGIGILGVGCDDDSSPVTPPTPAAPVDSVVFTVVTEEPDRGLVVRWIGSADGPLPSSPESTDRPWIGFGRPFRIRWQAWSKDGAVEGYRWLPGQGPEAPWLPATPEGEEPSWSTQTALRVENSHDESELVGQDCPGGPECPLLRRWESSHGGAYRFRLRAQDETGRILEYELPWEVNYPPQTRWESSPRPGESVSYPWVERWDPSGQLDRISFADGDTVAAGGYVTVRMGGFDRLRSAVDTDSFCCDLRFDDSAPELRFQARAFYRGTTIRGDEVVFSTFFNELGIEDTLGVVTGPLETTLVVRTADEWGRRDPDPLELTFVGGFPPRVRRIEPAGEDVVLLAPPDRAERWPQNTVDYRIERDVTRWWDIDNRRWWTVPVGNSRQVDGTVYRFDLRFVPGLDPRASSRTLEPAGKGLDGRARAWTYRFLTEYDPENEVRERQESPGLDGFFEAPTAGEAAVVESAYEVFVPDLLWTHSRFFDPDGACEDPVSCDIGRWVRRRLGLVTVEARNRTTVDAEMQLYPTTVRPSNFPSTKTVSDLGRVSDVGRALFPILLGLEQPDAEEPAFWPPRSVD